MTLVNLNVNENYKILNLWPCNDYHCSIEQFAFYVLLTLIKLRRYTKMQLVSTQYIQTQRYSENHSFIEYTQEMLSCIHSGTVQEIHCGVKGALHVQP